MTATPDTWEFDPFTLTRDGDKLMGRGVTDCLGHVALLTELFRQLAEKKPELQPTVVGVFIANEENATVREEGGAGVDTVRVNGGVWGGDIVNGESCMVIGNWGDVKGREELGRGDAKGVLLGWYVCVWGGGDQRGGEEGKGHLVVW